MSDLVRTRLPIQMPNTRGSTMAEIDWKPISERPKWDEQPGRQFIRIEGSRDHSGTTWHRIYVGLAFIRAPGQPDEFKGYRLKDMSQLCEDGDMDFWTAEVTHWAPATFSLPPQESKDV